MLIAVAKPKIASMVKQSQERSVRLPRFEERVHRAEQRASELGVNATDKALAVQKEQQQLKDVIRASIQQLVQYIFPIIPLQPIPRLEHICVIYFTIISVQPIPIRTPM